MLEQIVRDVRYAIRSWRRTPGFTVTALLTLALGIGANTAIFTILNGVLLRPLTYQNPQQLMHLSADSATSAGSPLSVPEYLEFRQMTRTFAAVGAYREAGGVYTTGEINLTAGDRPLRARSMAVDANLLDVLGLHPAQGRSFTAEETDLHVDRSLESPHAILSHELWQSAFNGRPIVGTIVRIDGRPFEIIGIMPPGADVMDHQTQVWLPLGLPRGITQSRGGHIVQVVGRLKDGVSAEEARAELDAFLANWSERTGATGHVPALHPANTRQHTLRLQPLQDTIVAAARRPIWLLQITVALVLLIACTNLANLTLARAELRRHEFAVRSALGADRGRLLRQAITEGLLLSGIGGLLGIFMARSGVDLLLRSYPDVLPRAADVGIDRPVLLFVIGLSLATGVLFGVMPAVQKRIIDVAALRQAPGSADGGRQRVRGTLVVAQFALTVVLATVAGLFIRTVYNLTSVDAGFDRTHLVTFQVTLAEPYDPDTRALAYQRMLDKLRTTTGVENASIVSGLPLTRAPQAVQTRFEQHTNAEGTPIETVDYYQLVIGDYFNTVGIPIVAGRGFDATDTAQHRRVVVINETLARRIYKGLDPIGRELRPNLGQTLGYPGNSTNFTVIGVAKDIKQAGVDAAIGSELFVPLEPLVFAAPTMNVLLRTTAASSALAAPIAQVVREIDPSVPVVRLRDMDGVFSESIRRPRLLAQLLGAFATLAVVLAAIGTYGVLSYLVASRRRDIGVRMALGADRVRVIRMVMSHGLALALLGVAIGAAGALASGRLIASLLFGVQPTDPLTAVVVVSLLLAIAAGACWLPAWRASRLDPNVVLRTQ